MIDTFRNGSINSPFNQQKKNFTQKKRNIYEICSRKYKWLPSFELMDIVAIL